MHDPLDRIIRLQTMIAAIIAAIVVAGVGVAFMIFGNGCPLFPNCPG
ncbi:hypothetical protein [Nocardia salmonicida]|nr:hypothetical protein [Nocardia salmonicida]